jgi:hypothetical protein
LIFNATFIELIKLETLCGRNADQGDFRRLRAAAVLAYCAGLWFPEIMALRRRHWLPEGLPCLRVERNERWLSRTIPASPATIWAVQQFIGPLPPIDQDTPIFPADALNLRMAIQRGLKRLGAPAANQGAGDLRASFEDRVMRLHPNDPLAFYLVGAAPTGDLRPLLRDPPLHKLDAVLRRSGLPYKGDDLWQVRERHAPALG